VYLLHVRDAVLKIEEYAKVGKQEFLSQSHWQDAIIRQLEIVGEASKRLSPSLREATAEVPWRQICGLRDVLIHNYMGVDLEAVWSVVESGIPVLQRAVQTILGTLSDP
jgi:uncharacterized protein with HEPN domain